MRQKTDGAHLTNRATGEARSAGTEGTEVRTAKTELESRLADWPSMEAIVERDNLRKALAQVKRNKGAAGVDGMSIDTLSPYLKEHWPTIRAQLLDGTYKPQPVRRVEIPKASGGKRPLGIPTVLDRFIQAVLQVLQADWDRTFSEHSYGFRPKRSAHQAVKRAQELIASRRRLRAVTWKQWKRGTTRFAELRRRGVGRDLAARTAGSPHGPWRLSNNPALTIALPNAFLASLGLASLAITKAA
jgi:RNA-directed DNA polymerase